ncbi:hypothetical protein [Amycolatopsis sacchari]|uniref:Uncharacterized protein n=1 Tax=Amycolatopsis sacchari TaxID=115433 RepID=A0A1I3LW95_9PSEU|nr:hypothetical protein [Amycolatopsis sacchari]SFI88992.1 hypothetical protein SAMN05421835_10270 [Amycolatopsis sacchari]
MQRLTRALAEAEAEIRAARTTTSDVETTLQQALTASSHCAAAYVAAPDHVKRQINQGFFEKLYIGEDGSVMRAELTEPFRALLDAGHVGTTSSRPYPHRPGHVPPPSARPASFRPPRAMTARQSPSVHKTPPPPRFPSSGVV